MDNSSNYLGTPPETISWETWLIVALVLAVLGFNVFYYLAQGTQEIHQLFAPVLGFFSNVAEKQASAVVGATSTLIPGDPNNVIQNAENTLASTLNTAGQTSIADNTIQNFNTIPESNSLHQKEGWCYIGEEQGYRSCASVGVNDHCMSGDIFPTRDICINPSLRQ